MTDKTIRPSLARRETELILEGLEQLSLAEENLDKMDEIRDTRARLAKAAQARSWWFR